jgi:FkbM family methyltransferase
MDLVETVARQTLDMKEGALWAYRYFLRREPENEAAVTWHAEHAKDPAALASGFTSSGEFTKQVEAAGRPPTAPRFPVDVVEGVRWGFRLLLRREPAEAEVTERAAGLKTVQDVRRAMILSTEFERLVLDHMLDHLRPMISVEVLDCFAPFEPGPPEDGSFRDFIGTLTRVSYLPTQHAWQSGTVEKHPSASRLHALAEWVGTLRSVIDAKDSFVAIELGAGWAPWLVGSAFAARKRGIKNIRLYGVEGSKEHYDFMLDHFRHNGLDPAAHDLHYAVVGAEDGVARFPRHVGSDDYGANAQFDGEGAQAREMIEVRCLALNSLLEKAGRVDLIHVDIQGHEEVVIRSAIEKLDHQVRRMVIGTHGRKIEEGLMELLNAHGWVFEHDKACLLQQDGAGRVWLREDGEQVWRNPRV